MRKLSCLTAGNKKHYWLMVLPALFWMFCINIAPIGGVIMAFEDFNPGLDCSNRRGSAWRILNICFS